MLRPSSLALQFTFSRCESYRKYTAEQSQYKQDVACYTACSAQPSALAKSTLFKKVK